MSMSWAEFSRRIEVIYSGPAHAPRTARKMHQVLELVRIHTGILRIDQLDTELAAGFVARRSATVSAATVRGDLAYLSAAATIAVEEGWLERPPRWKRIRPRRTKPVYPKVHAIAQVGAVLELLRSRSETWTGARLHAVAAVAAYTGLRRDEILWLKCEDVDLAAGLLRVVDRRRLKTQASAAAVPICPELRSILEAWLPRTGSGWLFPAVRKRDRPWVGGANGERPCERIREAGRECGVDGFTLSSLRHAFATWARRRWGLSSLELQEVLRHTSPRTQAWYLHPDPDPAAIVRAVERVSYRIP
jgi:integrase